MLATPSTNVGSFEIAPGLRNTDWQELNLTPESAGDDWTKAVAMFSKRMDRFLVPVDLMSSSEFSGFAIMALDCLLIETLQSFRLGRSNPVNTNDKQSKRMVVEFLTQRPLFKASFQDETKAKLFYDHFRNGILHQAEVKSSGRIRIDTPEMIMPSDDSQSLVVNRRIFHDALAQEAKAYMRELVDGVDTDLRRNFIKKMKEICRI
ncbi:MAG: hypothetical protein NT028_00025 [candidate division Zixibacteria bacterium]|nr:hypothetical protein [candidate division Zixibacteria bacterium]